jgi:hypothetical protein
MSWSDLSIRSVVYPTLRLVQLLNRLPPRRYANVVVDSGGQNADRPGPTGEQLFKYPEDERNYGMCNVIHEFRIHYDNERDYELLPEQPKVPHPSGV